MFIVWFILLNCIKAIVQFVYVFTGDCKTINKTLINGEFLGFNLKTFKDVIKQEICF